MDLKIKRYDELTRDAMHARDIYIETQKHAESFYKSCGFKTVSDVYMIVSIPHVEMKYYIEG